MGGKSQPDMRQAAIAQGEANREVVRDQTFANRPDQFTPFGYTTWNPYRTVDPSTGEATTAWQQTSGLTPELQSILNKQIAIQSGRSDIAGALTGRLGQEFGQQMDWRGLTPMGQAPTAQFTLPENLQRGIDYDQLPEVSTPQQQLNLDFSNAPGVRDPLALRQRAEETVFNTAAGNINRQYDQQREQLEIKLRNQGLAPGDQLYQQQMQQLREGQDAALSQAQAQALDIGRQEQAQLFGQDMGLRQMSTGELAQQMQFGNQALQNLYGMQSDLRGQLGSERERQAAFQNMAAQAAFDQARMANAQNYSQAMQQSQYANQLRQQQITEAMQKRGFSLNEINALLSGQQVGMPQMPSFMGAQAAQAAPIYQAAADQASVNAASNPFSAILGAGANLGSAALLGGFFGTPD